MTLSNTFCFTLSVTYTIPFNAQEGALPAAVQDGWQPRLVHPRPHSLLGGGGSGSGSGTWRTQELTAEV